MAKINSLGHYLETFLPFCQRNLYESAKTAVSADKVPLHFDGSCSSLMKQNLVHQWWLSTVTSFEEAVFGVVNSNETSDSDLLDISNDCLSNYPHILQFVGDRLPFGLAQIGSCKHSDELFTPRPSMSYLISQFFAPPSSSVQWFDQIQRHRLSWWKKFAATPTNYSTAHLKCEENKQKVEIQYKLPWDCQTAIETIYHHGSAPLLSLNNEAQLNLKGKDGRKLVLPHVIECVTFYETAMLTYLSEALRHKPYKGGTKLVLNVHRYLAPYKVSVTQTGGNAQLKELVQFLVKELKKIGVSVFHASDSSATLEQQFKKFDEMGIPYCVVLNENTLKSGVSGLRSRDTTLQEQVHIAEIAKVIKRYVSALND